MNLSNVFHANHAKDYIAGFENMLDEIHGMGWEAAREKFNLDNPIGFKPKNLGAYYYAKGGLDALHEKMPNYIR